MNDSNNEHTDDEADLFDATLNSHKDNEYKNDIYERFLQDIQNIGKNSNTNITASKTLEAVRRQPAYEPLNEEELLFFADSEENSSSEEEIKGEKEIDDLSADATVFVQDSMPNTVTIEPKRIESKHSESKNIQPRNTVVLELDIDEAPTPLLNQQKSNSTDNKRAGKLIVIGSLCGVLFIVVAVALSATGLLSKFTDTSALETTPFAVTEQAVALTVTEDANIPVEEVVATSQQNISETSTEKESTEPAKAELTVADSATLTVDKDRPNEVNNSTDNSQEADVQDQPTISFEDFQRESQNTVYRDSNE